MVHVHIRWTVLSGIKAALKLENADPNVYGHRLENEDKQVGFRVTNHEKQWTIIIQIMINNAFYRQISICSNDAQLASRPNKCAQTSS